MTGVQTCALPILQLDVLSAGGVDAAGRAHPVPAGRWRVDPLPDTGIGDAGSSGGIQPLMGTAPTPPGGLAAVLLLPGESVAEALVRPPGSTDPPPVPAAMTSALAGRLGLHPGEDALLELRELMIGTLDTASMWLEP